MRRIHIGPRSAKVWHIEAPGCVVNIRHGLRDDDGHEITSIQVIRDQAQGEAWSFPDYQHADALNVRVRKEQ